MSFLWVFWVNNKVADSGHMAIQGQRFSIVDTHEPAFARPLSPLCPCQRTIDLYQSPHRNRILLVRRHQEVRRFDSPGLHHIMPVSSHCGTSCNEGLTLTSFLPSPATILCHLRQQAVESLQNLNHCRSISWVASRKWCQGGRGTGA